MSNLKPLVWEDEAGSAMTTTIFRGYWATSDAESKDKFCVHYGSSKGEPARGFGSLEDAKNWAEHEHYANEMQPYVKPSPTWIDVNERLPEYKETLSDKDKCLVLTECGKVWTGFYNMHIKPDAWYLHGWTQKEGWHPFKIVAWMLANELSKQGE